MKKAFITGTVLLLLLFLLFSSPFPMMPATEPSLSSSWFSIVWMTDTQYLTQNYPSNFDTVCQWIASNAETLNVKAVIHTGDIINDRWNLTNCLTQWELANHSMSILLNNNIPYCWDAGNHDKNMDVAGQPWNGNNFKAFNATAMRKKPYWVADLFDGKNTAINFTASDWNFLVINIELYANDTVLQWVNNLLDAHNDSHVIIGTHAYINETCAYGPWATHFRDTVLANHSNVFMTLSGHWIKGVRTNRAFVDNRHELFFNYQETNGGLNDSTIRILTFDKEHNAIIINTYNPVTNQILTDPDNHFILNIPFCNNPNWIGTEQPIIMPSFLQTQSYNPYFFQCVSPS